MRQIIDTQDFLSELEARRKAQGKKMRAVSIEAGAAHGAYWTNVTKGTEPLLSSALNYARVLGLKIFVE